MIRNILKFLKIIILATLIVLLCVDIVGVYLGLILGKTVLGPRLLIETLKRHEAYAQIRQLIFKLVKGSLPNGRDSIPYLEKAISESWLEQEINMLLKNYYAFARGERKDTPIIFFSGLKRRVVDALDGDQPHGNRIRLVKFWFDPLPDEVRLEDFMSVDLLWGIRGAFDLMLRIPWIMGGIALFIILIMHLLLLDWRQSMLWFGAAIITAGALLILMGIAAVWAAGHMSILANMKDRLLSLDIPKANVVNFFNSFLNGIINPMNIIGTLSILTGGTLIYFVPIAEEPPKPVTE